MYDPKSTLVMKTKSELLFEGYIRVHGYTAEYEKPVPGTEKRPDYCMRFDGADILFEVKEFVATERDFRAGFGGFDPYPVLREKIEAARKKFRDLETHCCSLVLHNVNKPLVLLDWQFIYGAMLGNLGFSVPLDLPGRPRSEDAAVTQIFMSGGKMIRERRGVPVEPQNTTISAIVVLGRVPVGERLWLAEVRSREAAIGRKFTFEETWASAEQAAGKETDLRRRQLRVVVHENPYARIPFPANLFCGPYDERYGGRDGRIQRVFRGRALSALPSKFDD
jgi:hypothetical protein